MTQTKDKKLKPVIHTGACVGAEFIVAIYPHTIGSNLCNMMNEMVNTMDPSRNDAIRSQIKIFIDRGYLQLAKPQVEPVTNLIQLMQNNLKVRFLGTIKKTPVFPFIIDVNNTENSTRCRGEKVIINTYRHRTSFICLSRTKNTKIVVFRHGFGKSRAARLITNSSMFLDNKWVCQTTKGFGSDGEVLRIPNKVRPPVLGDNATLTQQINHKLHTHFIKTLANYGKTAYC